MNKEDWNWNISEAPKSTIGFYERTRGGKVQNVEKTDSVWIMAAYPDGKTVAKTRYLPDAGRWEGFCKGQEPVAWQHWPEHPGKMPDQ